MVKSHNKGFFFSVFVFSWVVFFALPGVGACLPSRYGGDFLNIGAGAREMSLAETVSATTISNSSMCWNPSGLYFVSVDHLTFQHTFYNGSLADFHFLAYSLPLGTSAQIGIGWFRFGVENIPEYPDLDPEERGVRVTDPDERPDWKPLGYFSSADNAFYFSIARGWSGMTDLGWIYKPFHFGLSGGVSLKIIRQNIAEYTGAGIGLDVGVTTEINLGEFMGYDRLGLMRYGFSMTDVSATSIAWNTPSKRKDSVAPLLRTGISYRQVLPLSAGSLMAAWDAKFDLNHQEKLANSVGLEYGYADTVFLRMGKRGGSWTAGAGLRYWKLALDYAFISYGVEPSHRIELGITPGFVLEGGGSK